jgi:2-methylcitrate dehydratase PrpD
LDGAVGPRQVLPPRLHDPRLLSLMNRVNTEAAPEFEAEFPAKAPAEVIVETSDGRTFSSGRIQAPWEPPDTLPTDGDLEAKFLWLTAPVLGETNASSLMKSIWSADQWETIAPLLNGCWV